MSDKKDSIARLIGVIGKPRGINGEVYVRWFTDYPNTIKPGDKVYVDEDCAREIVIEDINKLSNKSRTVLKFLNHNSRNDAEKLRGCLIFRKEKDRPEILNGQYWIDDIIDCDVYSSGNSIIGRVRNVENFPTNDSLIVELNESGSIKNNNKSKGGNNNIIIPMVEDFIMNIDVKNKKIILKKLPEYI